MSRPAPATQVPLSHSRGDARGGGGASSCGPGASALQAQSAATRACTGGHGSTASARAYSWLRHSSGALGLFELVGKQVSLHDGHLSGKYLLVCSANEPCARNSYNKTINPSRSAPSAYSCTWGVRRPSFSSPVDHHSLQTRLCSAAVDRRSLREPAVRAAWSPGAANVVLCQLAPYK